MAIIVDASAIVAWYDEGQAEHDAIVSILPRLVRERREKLIVSPMIVVEADYLLADELGPRGARYFAEDLVNGAFELATWSVSDHAVALGVIDSYHGDYVGIADASNVVLADRYRTTELMTLDQRHFRMLRPIWGANHFRLLPYDEVSEG
ncbi:PIN domain-containing protein [Tenggerimyces flavus]|uniref:Ribonuclease VapC n=1 Tax=Tenggerimyces flavus TaxID=1708749 RepID=A0ABV7YC76_9ACTN|nr:PIN domain-containing protein [Tenggerimyces flavus]MBM7783430.1 putative nucleic acid-binding protein [Tenggerimyces flavus]